MEQFGLYSSMALWFQQRANSQQSTSPLTYWEFLQWLLNFELVGDAQVQLQVFAEGIRSYYQNIIQTLGSDRVDAFSPTDNIPNEAQAMLAETKGPNVGENSRECANQNMGSRKRLSARC